jgi:arylsulfatase A-like enzyme
MLAQSGTLFEKAYCQMAICSPSRVSFLTGLRPDTTRVFDLKTPPRAHLRDIQTLPEVFKRAGYEVVSVGKVFHNSSTSDRSSWSRPEINDTNWRQFFPELDRPAASSGAANGGIGSPKTQPSSGAGNGKDRKSIPSTRMTPDGDRSHGDIRMTDVAGILLREFKANQTPFFLAVGFHRPHLPFGCPGRFWRMYDRTQIPLPKNTFFPKNMPPWAAGEYSELRAYADIPKSGEIPEEKVRELIHGYYACIAFVDDLVGQLMAELKSTGLSENTVVVLLGDHGFHLGENNHFCKHTNFEMSTRTPLIISFPGREPSGRRVSEIVELVDVFPTLCALTHVSPPMGLQGMSLVQLMRGDASGWPNYAISQYRRGGHLGYSIRTTDFRYTEWTANTDVGTGTVAAAELYDHVRDPDENVNVASEARFTQHVGLLSASLRRALNTPKMRSSVALPASASNRGGEGSLP